MTFSGTIATAALLALTSVVGAGASPASAASMMAHHGHRIVSRHASRKGGMGVGAEAPNGMPASKATATGGPSGGKTNQ